MATALALAFALQDDVDGLLARLADPDPAVRDEATAALIERGAPVLPHVESSRQETTDPEVVARLDHILREIDRAERWNALPADLPELLRERLRRFDTEDWARILADLTEDFHVHNSVFRRVPRGESERLTLPCGPLRQEIVDYMIADVRPGMTGAEALAVALLHFVGRFDRSEDRAWVAGFLDAQDTEIQRAAWGAFRGLATEEDLPTVVEALGGRDAGEAAKTLAAIRTQAAAAALEHYLVESPEVQHATWEIAAELDPSIFRRRRTRLLTHPDADVRCYMMVEQHPTEDEARAGLEDQDLTVQERAAMALSRTDPAAALRWLRTASRDVLLGDLFRFELDDFIVRAAAQGEPLDAVEWVLDLPTPWSWCAAQGIARAYGREGAQRLLEASTTGDADRRSACAWALAKHGEADPSLAREWLAAEDPDLVGCGLTLLARHSPAVAAEQARRLALQGPEGGQWTAWEVWLQCDPEAAAPEAIRALEAGLDSYFLDLIFPAAPAALAAKMPDWLGREETRPLARICLAMAFPIVPGDPASVFRSHLDQRALDAYLASEGEFASWPQLQSWPDDILRPVALESMRTDGPIPAGELPDLAHVFPDDDGSELIEMLASTRDRARLCAALGVLARLGAPVPAETVRSLLQDPDHATHSAAARLVWFAGPRELELDVAALLRGVVPYEENALHALIRLRSPLVLDFARRHWRGRPLYNTLLKLRLDSLHDEYRRIAQEAREREDSDLYVRALCALAELGDPEAREPLAAAIAEGLPWPGPAEWSISRYDAPETFDRIRDGWVRLPSFDVADLEVLCALADAAGVELRVEGEIPENFNPNELWMRAFPGYEVAADNTGFVRLRAAPGALVVSPR